MKKIKKGVWNMDKDVDVIYSPDEKGYYFQSFATNKVTKIYASMYYATHDYRNKRLKWIEDQRP